VKATALKLHATKGELEQVLQQAHARLEAGLAPTDDADVEWAALLRQQEMLQELQAQREQVWAFLDGMGGLAAQGRCAGLWGFVRGCELHCGPCLAVTTCWLCWLKPSGRCGSWLLPPTALRLPLLPPTVPCCTPADCCHFGPEGPCSVVSC
jgi:hypothetical protein